MADKNDKTDADQQIEVRCSHAVVQSRLKLAWQHLHAHLAGSRCCTDSIRLLSFPPPVPVPA